MPCSGDPCSSTVNATLAPEVATLLRWMLHRAFGATDVSVLGGNFVPHHHLQLLSELADAISTVHSFIAIARVCAEVLHQKLPLRSFELARREPSAPTFQAVLYTFRAGDPLVVQKQRPLSETPLESPVGFSSGLEVLVFRGEGEIVGYAALAQADEHAESLPQAFLDALTHVLQGAYRNIALLERVASLSRRAHVENQLLRSELLRAVESERVAAVSESSRRVLAMADLVAAQDTTVLLRGESGTGKEVLARRIHRLSGRSNRPFLKINCGALPEGLVESTLFGHEKGAFTGASGRHRGFFERAHGGTLLLDEVAELPLGAQAKLLRILQDGELERVGGESSQRVDVRLIAATHRGIEQMIQAGTFRSDLYYRLNIFPIVLPPLRERREDIPVLVEVLLDKLARRHDRPMPQLTPEVLAQLRQHSFPGNVRELENLLERAMILTPMLEPLRLPDDFAVQRGAVALSPAPGRVLTQPYSDVVRETIEQALRQSGGQIYGAKGAAALLGLKPTTLQSKMRKLNIQRESFVRE